MVDELFTKFCKLIFRSLYSSFSLDSFLFHFFFLFTLVFFFLTLNCYDAFMIWLP